MSVRRLRIALWNGAGMNNLGDHAIDLVTRRELAKRLPGVTAATFSPWQGRYCQNRLWIDRDGIWPGHGAFDAIVIGGGALILGPPFADPSAQFFLLGPNPDRFGDHCPVLWNGVCCDSQYRAPLSPLWRAFVSTAADRIGYRAVRNERSRQFLADCGVDGVELIPDICVIAGDNSPARSSTTRPKVAVAAGRPVFPDWFIHKVGAMAQANMTLTDPDLIDMNPYGVAAHYSDREYAARLHTALAPLSGAADLTVVAFGEMYGDDLLCSVLADRLEARYLKLWDFGLDEILQFFAQMDVVVGSRLHACVFALSVGTPFIAVDPYFSEATKTSKLKEFMSQCGLDACYFSVSQFLDEPEKFAGALRGALRRRPEIAATRARLAVAVRIHFDRLAEAIAA